MLSINLNNLNYSYSEEANTIFKNLSAKFIEGDKILIRGKNGSGKSTLLQILASLIKTKEVSYNGFKEFSAPFCGYLSHNLNLYNELNALEHFQFFSKLIFKNEDKKDEFKNLLEKFNLDKKFKVPVYELSKGEKAKLSLILKLFFKPKILLLDEPETALDKEARNTLLAELESLSEFYKQKNIIIIVSHTDLFNNWANKEFNL